MRNLSALSIICFLSILQTQLFAVNTSLESKNFLVTPDDTLLIKNDYGRVLVHETSNPQLQVHIRKIASTSEKLDNIRVLFEKAQNKIFIYSSFEKHHSESVYLEIEAPSYINVIVWGINTAVEIYGMQGYVRAHTLTGLITAEDLTSSVSLTSDSGDIE